MENINRNTEREYIMVFKNTHDAVGGEKVISEKGIAIVVVPTPTHITQSCGISLKFNESELERIKELIIEGSVTPKNIYVKEGKILKLYT